MSGVLLYFRLRVSLALMVARSDDLRMGVGSGMGVVDGGLDAMSDGAAADG